EGLLGERLEELGRLVERLPDAGGTLDREAVAGEQELRAELRHPAQRGRPIARVALDLLGIAGVGRGPDEEVAGAADATRRQPDPGMVVGLAAAVVQLDPLAADLERVARDVGLVGGG